MIAWLEGKVWQIGAIGAGVAAASLGVALVISQVQKAEVTRHRDGLQQVVLDQARDLATARGNYATCKASLETQNAEVSRLGAVSDELRAESARIATAAEKDRLTAERKIAALSKPLTAIDSCARVYEMDRRLLESLK